MGFLAEFDAAPDPAKVLVLAKWIAADPLGMYAELRPARPVLQVPSPAAGIPPTVVLSLYDDVREALTRNAIFQVVPYARAIDPSVGPFMLARDDTTINQRDKSVMLAVLRREDLPLVRDLVRKHAEASIREFGTTGQLEVVSTLGRRVPILLCGSYFGFPGPDEATMFKWSRATQFDMFHNLQQDPQVHAACIAAGQEMHEYLAHYIPERRAALRHGVLRDDTLSRLLKTDFPAAVGWDEERLTDNVMGLLVGAGETTNAAVTQALNVLFDRPAEFAAATAAAKADDHDAVARYVWEALRFNPVNPLVVRLSVAPYTIAKGTARAYTIPPGTIVFIGTASAMHDPLQLDQPEAFIPGRADYDYFHLGFGAHTCLGNLVSLEQVPEILAALLRLPGLRRAEGPAGQLDFKGGPFPESLVVAFDHA
jgi:cytochrome P450